MSITLVRNEDQIDVRDDGVLIGYLDDNGILYGINNSGYADKIGEVSHRSEIVGKIYDWQKKQQKEMDV